MMVSYIFDLTVARDEPMGWRYASRSDASAGQGKRLFTFYTSPGLTGFPHTQAPQIVFCAEFIFHLVLDLNWKRVFGAVIRV